MMSAADEDVEAAHSRSGSGSRLVQVGGYVVSLFNDEHFAKCRAKYNVTARVLANFKFEEMGGGGGKGGEVMAFTPDKRYIVKQVAGNDHDALLRHVGPICQQLLKGSSILSTMFYHFEIAEGPHAGCYFVMNNCLPVLPKQFKWRYMFDLKGCCDDKVICEDGERVEEVHKRCFSCGTCWYGCDLDCCGQCNTAERRKYFQGKRFALEVKFPVDARSKSMIDHSIGDDCDFLQNQIQTMDYSLIVGTVVIPKGQEKSLPPSPYAHQPYLAYTSEDEVTAYYFGIIDFLQEWTGAKKIAHIIKCCFAPKPISTINPDEYAVQFSEHFADKFIATQGAEVPYSHTRAEIGETQNPNPPSGVEMVDLEAKTRTPIEGKIRTEHKFTTPVEGKSQAHEEKANSPRLEGKTKDSPTTQIYAKFSEEFPPLPRHDE